MVRLDWSLSGVQMREKKEKEKAAAGGATAEDQATKKAVAAAISAAVAAKEKKDKDEKVTKKSGFFYGGSTTSAAVAAAAAKPATGSIFRGGVSTAASNPATSSIAGSGAAAAAAAAATPTKSPFRTSSFSPCGAFRPSTPSFGGGVTPQLQSQQSGSLSRPTFGKLSFTGSSQSAAAAAASAMQQQQPASGFGQSSSIIGKESMTSSSSPAFRSATTSQEHVSTPGNPKSCHFCGAVSRNLYRCPRCYVAYCGLKCFKNEKHAKLHDPPAAASAAADVADINNDWLSIPGLPRRSVKEMQEWSMEDRLRRAVMLCYDDTELGQRLKRNNATLMRQLTARFWGIKQGEEGKGGEGEGEERVEKERVDQPSGMPTFGTKNGFCDKKWKKAPSALDFGQPVAAAAAPHEATPTQALTEIRSYARDQLLKIREECMLECPNTVPFDMRKEVDVYYEACKFAELYYYVIDWKRGKIGDLYSTMGQHLCWNGRILYGYNDIFKFIHQLPETAHELQSIDAQQHPEGIAMSVSGIVTLGLINKHDFYQSFVLVREEGKFKIKRSRFSCIK